MSTLLPANEEERLHALYSYNILDTAPDVAFERITNLAARLFKVPVALVSFVDRDRQWFKSCFGIDVHEMPREISFCTHAILSDQVLIVPDTTKDPRFQQNPLVTGAPHVRFYAGAPLKTASGFNLGTLCILDRVPRSLDEEQKSILQDLAAAVMDEIELRLSEAQLRREVLERRQTEDSLHEVMRENNRLSAAIMNLSSGVIITDAIPGENRIIYANPGFCKMTGYALSEIIGRNCRFLQGEGTDRFEIQKMREAIAQKRSYHGVVLDYRKNGSSFYNEVTINPVFDEDTGEIINFVGLQADVTPRLQAAEALQKAKEEAEKANRAKSEFLSRMSHELRTPLNAILGFSQILEMGELSSDQQKSNGHILRAGKHLLGLINEVLDIARVEAGRIDLACETIQVAEVIPAAVSLVLPLAAQRKIVIDMNQVISCRHILATDRQRLTQVLINLISNAIKYNREEGQVLLTCEKIAGNRLRIGVADTGPGIPPNDIEKLFVPFERLGANDSHVEGTGLGLTLSKRLIEAMEGTLTVESVFGEGSRFHIELPIDGCKPSVEGTFSPSSQEGDSNGSEYSQRVVLQIEDNLANYQLVERILDHRPGIKLMGAMQGSIGLDMARQHRPDLILLDIQLPDMSGVEVLKALHESPVTCDIPVVIITADAVTKQREQLIAAGAKAFLTKPVDVHQLLGVLDLTLYK